jgi:hypothetical protein
MSILVVSRFEKRITQRHRLNALHIRIHDKLGINVKKNRHVHRLARIQALLFETKALNLAEVRRYLSRRHAVRGYSNDILGRFVRRSVKSQGGFARQDTDFALLRDEFPGKDVGHGTVEGYA